MSTTFGQFKSAIRGRIWPPGSGEPDNLVASHDKAFVDALVDLQTWVECLRQDNTDLYEQCSTTYNCGLTVLLAPRGIIKKLSVIDKINPNTGKEDATAADDYCSEITYTEVDFCHVRRFLDRSRIIGACCSPIGLYFGLPFVSYRPEYPTPTDEGVAPGLPPLPMGFHYPQTSTDRTYGRAGAGIWAKNEGNIYVAPWIQSTETIIIRWEGIKRTWNNGDPIDDDPLLAKAVEEYVRWQHSRIWEKDEAAAQDASGAYGVARSDLIHQCREETRVRQCEPSHARASTIGLSTLYYNDDQSFVAKCPDGQVGTPVSITVQAGTVGSNVSVADANQKALAQARAQAQAQLVCTAEPVTYTNSIAYRASSSACAVIDTNAPPPTCVPATVLIPAGSVTSTVSVDDANAKAQAKAQSDADAQLSCTYYNSSQSYTQACPDGSNPVTKTVAPGQYSATSKGTAGNAQSNAQASANAKALQDAKNQAVTAFTGTDCGSGASGAYWNTAITSAGMAQRIVIDAYGARRHIEIRVDMPAHVCNDTSQLLANQDASSLAQDYANYVADAYSVAGPYGYYQFLYPDLTTPVVSSPA